MISSLCEMRLRHASVTVLFFTLTGASAAYAAGTDGPGEHFLWLAMILVFANVAASLVQKMSLPGVLGELLVGIVLGNLVLVGIASFEPLATDRTIAFIAEFGVVILLFQIGLESSVGQMRSVGTRAASVAVLGVAIPFALGTFVAGPLLIPGLPFAAYLFIGATLTATSVGITGRVFQDLGRLQMKEAQIVLGAAVIDDVLGLVILAVVSSIVQVGSISVAGVGVLILEAFAFLAGSIWLGRLVAPWLSRALAGINAGMAMKLALMLAVCLSMAWMAHAIGLAPIVGAFAAGLILEPVFLADFDEPRIVRDLKPLVGEVPQSQALPLERALADYKGHHHHRLIEPLGYFFVPVFFVHTGMQVDLATFLEPRTLLVGLGVTAVAVIGKLLAGLAAGPVGRMLVGWGMVPRGEVGLIFAMVGRQLGVVSDEVFSVIIIMVILTTLITPLVLTRLLRDRQ